MTIRRLTNAPAIVRRSQKARRSILTSDKHGVGHSVGLVYWRSHALWTRRFRKCLWARDGVVGKLEHSDG
jgi:hypothetical protein